MRYFIVAVMLLVFTGCRDKPPEKTVIDPLLKTLDKARSTEQKMQEGADKTAADIERATAGEPTE